MRQLDKDGKPDAPQTLNRLRGMRDAFAGAAKDDRNAADTIGDALALIDAADDDALRLKQIYAAAAEDKTRARDTIDTLIKKVEAEERRKAAIVAGRFRERTGAQGKIIRDARASAKNSEFAVFIDRSGSITARPFSAALDGAAVLAAPLCFFAGAPEPQWVKSDLLDPSTRAGYFKSGPSSDFAPAVTEMIKSAAVNKLNGKRSHFIVISDGGFHDYPAAKKELEKLFGAHLRATVDFVIMGASGSSMEFLSEQLAKDHPRRIRHYLVNGPAYWQGTEEDLSAAVQEKVAAAVALRLHPPRASRKPTPKPQ